MCRNQNHTYLFFCKVGKQYIFFGVLQNFSNSFRCAMRWKRLAIADLTAMVSRFPLVMLGVSAAFFPAAAQYSIGIDLVLLITRQ